MFYFIKQILKKFKVIAVLIQRILLPVEFFILKKDFNSKINIDYESKFNKNVKWALSSIFFKGKKITTYRCFDRSFKMIAEVTTALVFSSNDRYKEFKSGDDPRLFKYRNKILLYFQRPVKYKRGMDCEICLYDPHLNKVYKINSPFKFNGKNWIPLSGLNSLIFIYSVYPLIILKVVNLNKGKMKVINKIEKGIKPRWERYIESTFCGSKRGGSPVVKVNNYTYLGIGHSTEYFNSKFKFLGSKHKAYVYLFDFKKNNYYTNYLTRNPFSWVDAYGAELINKGNKIRFHFSFSTNYVGHILSKIYLFNVELDKKKLIYIARKGLKKKINLITNYKSIN